MVWREELKNQALIRIFDIYRHNIIMATMDFAKKTEQQQRELTAKKALVWFEDNWQDYVDTEAETLCFKPEFVPDFLEAMREEERPSPQPSPVK